MARLEEGALRAALMDWLKLLTLIDHLRTFALLNTVRGRHRSETVYMGVGGGLTLARAPGGRAQAGGPPLRRRHAGALPRGAGRAAHGQHGGHGQPDAGGARRTTCAPRPIIISIHPKFIESFVESYTSRTGTAGHRFVAQ